MCARPEKGLAHAVFGGPETAIHNARAQEKPAITFVSFLTHLNLTKRCSMPVQSSTFQVKTLGFNDTHDVTPRVREFLRTARISNGVVTVFTPGSTAGITTIEYESGVLEDLRKAIERLVPQGIHYDHDARWGDGNGFSHVRAALLGPSLSVPLVKGELQLGTWQQITLIDFDNRPRNREVVVQVVGE